MVQGPGRPSPALEETPVVRRAGEWYPAHDAQAGARVVGPRGHRTSARHEVGRWQGEPEPRLKGAGSRRAAYEHGRRGTGVALGPDRAQAARVGVNFRREPGPTLRRWRPCHQDL